MSFNRPKWPVKPNKRSHFKILSHLEHFTAEREGEKSIYTWTYYTWCAQHFAWSPLLHLVYVGVVLVTLLNSLILVERLHITIWSTRRQQGPEHDTLSSLIHVERLRITVWSTQRWQGTEQEFCIYWA